MKINNLFIKGAIIITLLSCNDKNTLNEVELIAGTGAPGFIDGENAELNKPIRFSAFKNNTVLFADINNHAIRFVTKGGVVKTIAGGPDKKGFKDGNSDSARFNSPHGVAYNESNNTIYVASASNHVIRKITSTDDENYEVSMVAGIPQKSGYRDGPVDSALFNSPHGVLVREDGALVVIDIGNAKLRLIKNNVVSTIAGKSEEDPLKADFLYPIDLAFDGHDILIADAGNHKIFRVSPGVSAEEIVVKDTLNTPHGITVDESGNIFIADMGSNRIIQINKDGSFIPIMDSVADTLDICNLNKPAAVLYDNGSLWIADLNNHQIKRVVFH